ncbi:AT-rich interactive domain-containing protein 1B [Drosophila ficusphila]|uniref:AT-rich interactive domain-containing protein 1B n=1 Tax=Drosophila ficusphila TaxID=30025 RepID=UPI0007E6F83C|nr:AT-rich interactive domain-containing protein 1B [Drosophila ficusphila]
MSSAVDIQIVSMPNLAKIESFLKDVSYRETIEYSANFNTRLCIERRLRLPFLDPQTGVAQNHSQLFLDKRQRMPGFKQGQIYTYPAARWRKSRRQYLNKMYSRFPERPFQALRKEHEALVASGANLGLSSLNSGAASIPGGNSLASSSSLTLNMLTGGGAAPAVLGSLHSGDTAHDFNGAFSLEESSSLGAAGGDTSDSKDSQQQQQAHQQIQQHHQQQQAVKEEQLPKDWFYDDMDMNDVDSLEEPKSPADDEYDYDPRYGNKKRRKRRPGKRGGDSGGGGGGGGASGGGNSGAGSSSRRRSAAARSRITTTDAALDASLEAIESGESVPGSNGGTVSVGGILSSSLGAGLAGVSGSGGGAGGAAGAAANSRRSRGAGTRGRRRTKGPAGAVGAACDPTIPGMGIEPPSFESAAAAVGVVEDANAHLRNYRKYL